MFLHDSAYLDQNLYRAGFPGRMHQEYKIQHRQEKYVNTRIQPAHCWFRYMELQNCYGFGAWHSGHSWRPLWGRLSVSVRSGCTCSFASAACLQILSCAIVAKKPSGHVVITTHSHGSVYRSPHICMPIKLNTPLLHFTDLSARSVDAVLRFHYCSVRKPFFGHFGHMQGQAHVGLFQLYPTSLPCHSSSHVENLQEIRCCF